MCETRPFLMSRHVTTTETFRRDPATCYMLRYVFHNASVAAGQNICNRLHNHHKPVVALGLLYAAYALISSLPV